MSSDSNTPDDDTNKNSGFGCEVCFDDPPTEPVVT